MYNSFGANTVQVSEGTVGSGISASVGTTTATIGELTKSIAHRREKNLAITVKLFLVYRHLTIQKDNTVIRPAPKNNPRRMGKNG